MAEVMRTDPGTAEHRLQRTVTVGTRCAVPFQGDRRVFPGMPVLGSLQPDLEIRVSEQPAVGGKEATVPTTFGHTVPESAPLLGKEPRKSAVEPVDFIPSRGSDRRDDDLRRPLR